MPRFCTFFIIAVAVLILAPLAGAQQDDIPVLQGPYLGQALPGDTPAVFAPGFVSLPKFTEYSGSFAPDGSEYYFYRFSDSLPATIYVTKNTVSGWTSPAPVDFAKGYPADEPHITLDNKRLYFAWEKGSEGIPGIWVVKRDSIAWSEPSYAGQGMFVSSDSSGNVYVTDMSSAARGRTFLARVTLANDSFAVYNRLDIAEHYGQQAHPCVAPDGSYIIFDVDGGHHLYVCFREPDGTWGDAVDLTKHGFDPMAGGATVSPDGKYLFFCLNRDVWWVSTSRVEKLRPE